VTMDTKLVSDTFIQDGREVFQRAIEGIRCEAKADVDSIPGLDNEQLLLTYYILHYWCVDAILRLIHAKPKYESLNWVDVWNHVSHSVRRYDLDLLVKVAIHADDLASTIDILKIWGLREEYRSEIFRRLEGLKFSRQLLKYLRGGNSIFKLAELFEVTTTQVKAWIKHNKRVSASNSHLLRALKLQPSRSDRYESPARILGTAPQNVQDTRSPSVLVIHELYESRKNQLALNIDEVQMKQVSAFGEPAWIRDGDTLQVSASPIVGRYSELSVWDEALHDELLTNIRERVNCALPILDGSMEKAPLKVHDYHRTIARRYSKELQSISYDELYDEESEGGEGDLFSLSKIEWQYLHDYGFMDKPDIVDVIHASNKLIEILETKLQNVNPPRKKSQIRRAIGLVLLKDYTATNAAYETKLSQKTVLKYIHELGLSDF